MNCVKHPQGNTGFKIQIITRQLVVVLSLEDFNL